MAQHRVGDHVVLYDVPVRGGAAGADDTNCTQVASPGDSINSFVNSLNPGDVGCLHGGTYHGDVSMSRGGSGDDSRIVVRSVPGERATIAGRLTVSEDADYVTFEQLELDGRDAPACDPGATCDQLPSPTVNGDHVTFQDNEVTNHHVAICFNLGHPGYGRPQGVVIQRNRIHDCGHDEHGGTAHAPFIGAKRKVTTVMKPR